MRGCSFRETAIPALVVLSELCRDLVDGLVLCFRNLEPDVDDEPDLSQDEDGKDVGSHQELK